MIAAPSEVPRAALLSLEHAVLERVATGDTLAAALDYLCRRVEEMAPGVVATIILVKDGKLRPVAAPSMPEALGRAIDGIPIGPSVGSCGTAAWTGEAVVAADMRTDPLWRDFLYLPVPKQLVACWSSPIKSRAGKVIGTFAFYFREKRGPSKLEEQIVATCVHLCAVAIESDMAWSETRRLAYEDTLTGLMNRSAFQERATQALRHAEAGGPPVAFHVIDVDEFKDVNDSLGHDVGDMLLVAIAGRLRSVVGHEGLVARLGGDEFAVLQPHAPRERAADLAWRVLDAFATPFPVDDRQIAVNASIGIAVAPDDGSQLAEIMKHADLALYGAKATGRGRARFFTPDLAENMRRRRALANDLKQALDNGELALVYQPIVCLRSQALVGFEALMRWNSPARGEVLPSQFIALAEDNGLIHAIGRWLLKEACTQAKRWPDAIDISVNISPVQLRVAGFAADARRIVAESGLSPSRVVLEITESAVLDTDATTRECLVALRQAGFRVSLDDFGTGYSSLKALRVVEIDKIKIDKAFVGEFNIAEASTSIVHAIVAIARSLGIRTTAEGIEAAEQAVQLAAEGCDEGQGYYFSRPLAAEAAYAFTRTHQAHEALPRAASA
jgi:diguanylate cyclase (GGDEF)-like protein